MKKLNLILIVFTTLFSILIISCSKNLENSPPAEQVIELPVFTGTYKSDSMLEIHPPSLHTIDGTITDKSIISEYLERLQLASYYDLRFTSQKFTHETFEIRFDSTNNFKVQIRGNSHLDTTGRIYSVDENRVVILIDTEDSIERLATSSCMLKVRLASEFQIFDSCTFTATGVQKCRYKWFGTFNRRQENLELPMLTATVSQGMSGTFICSAAWTGGLSNYLNPNLSSLLRKGDTMVTQFKTLKLIKQ